MTRTILILTSKTGGGHISLAEALRDCLQDADTTIEMLDPQSSFFHWHYRLLSRYALWLWSTEFQFLNTPQRSHFTHRIFARLVAKKLGAAIQRLQPDLIITTYPYLTYEVVQWLKQQKMNIPFTMLFTDPKDVHASWLTEKRADATLAPTNETYEQAISAGFEVKRLHQVGWPVRMQFVNTDTSQRDETLQGLNLDPAKFTIFLQGGGEGAARFGRTVERLLSIDPTIQIILATGTNYSLQEQFKHVSNIYPLSFTKDIARYMAAADVIMGKAGPNMLFEAVTLGKPFIATTYIPGQEKANLAFIRQHRLGWVALTIDEQITLLQKLVSQREILHEMEDAVAKYQQYNTNQTALIVPILEQLLQPR
ncbi:MGDG synthase family glycosyltransferase [Dictyobacter arantiisoli]|uniref:Galactosyldiacylglycerol synthase n=1 Tax=Dictyobacter arantiisoli TaxID=2014874 RepID=A0A5A5TGQ4_9CHLR|nr:glycosyltransferase [Dictyobacter arantiisoli]GCF10336.1 galactosyldiacylglycerol synthase [Dictyobacter arantiisoli]